MKDCCFYLYCNYYAVNKEMFLCETSLQEINITCRTEIHTGTWMGSFRVLLFFFKNIYKSSHTILFTCAIKTLLKEFQLEPFFGK